MNTTHKSFAVAACSLALLAGVRASHGPSKAAKKPTYKAVEAILDAKCLSCHNDARHPEKVNLSSYAKLMKSGEKHPTVTAGHPEKSNLYLYTDGEKQPRMPFRQAPLDKEDIQTLRDWIKAGAKD